MTVYSLPEYGPLAGVPLSPDEVAALLRMRPAPLNVAPSVERPGCFDLRSGSLVGVVRLATCSITIHPKLPIDRLLFMLAYGMDPRHWRSVADRFEARDSLLESIIPGFVYQVRQALRRGVLQGYRTREESLATVRGRIRFGDQIRRRYGVAPPIEVRYDEFTEDILENRLIKAALRRLTRLPIRAGWVRRSLREFDLALERVSLPEYPQHQIPDVAYTRLNERYRPAVNLARLILRATSFDLGSGAIDAAVFLVDMNRLFEDFVVTALREAFRGSPGRLLRGWQGPPLRLDRAGKIALQPDLTWQSGGRRRFVGDVKYKRTEDNLGHNADMYQALAYAIAADLPSGTLIYAKGEADPAEHDIVHAGKRLRVLALNLEQPPEGILAQIAAIAGEIRSAVM